TLNCGGAMSKEARITIVIGILSLAIAYLAWQYPKSQQSANQNDSNISLPSNMNSPLNANRIARVLNNNGNNNITLPNNGNVNTPPPPPSGGSVLARYEERGVLIECTLCRMEGNFVTCEFLLENRLRGDRDLWLFTTDYYNKGSRMYDESNNEYQSSVVQIGNK